jgi:bacterioferritin
MLKGNKRILDVLSGVLKNELTAVNQYFIHYKMSQHWGFTGLAKISYQESIDEMKHADEVMERILSLDGSPNKSEYGKIKVGKDIKDQLKNDLELELRAIPFLNEGIEICREEGDNTSREMLERFLIEEEKHAEWLETQLSLIQSIGEQNYLAQYISGGEGGMHE